MKKYFGVAQDRQGNILPGATAQIIDSNTGVDRALFEDDGTTPKSNPITCDVNGQFQFTSKDGLINIVINYATYTNTYTNVSHFEDPHAHALENAEATNFVFGEVGYIFGDGTVKKAISDGTEAEAQADVICMETVLTPGSTGQFKTFAKLAIAGTAGNIGYLSQLSEITDTVPTSGAGDTFSTILGKWFEDNLFVFNPRGTVGVF
jgi:hypothetical protein